MQWQVLVLWSAEYPTRLQSVMELSLAFSHKSAQVTLLPVEQASLMLRAIAGAHDPLLRLLVGVVNSLLYLPIGVAD